MQMARVATPSAGRPAVALRLAFLTRTEKNSLRKSGGSLARYLEAICARSPLAHSFGSLSNREALGPFDI